MRFRRRPQGCTKRFRTGYCLVSATVLGYYLLSATVLLQHASPSSSLTVRAPVTMKGAVLGVDGLSNWAVVGDVTNPSKPAFRVASRLEDSGRTVIRVSPYAEVEEGVLYNSLSDVPTDVRIDAVNLVISPTKGVGVLKEMAERNVKYCFIQPGADGGKVLARAAELGITVEQGCVLVQPLPPLK